MLKKALALLFSICLIAVSFGFSTGAVAQIVEGGNITIDKVEAYAGNEVIVGINIENNPGIMAVTVGIGYDSSALSFEGYKYGDVFTDYTVSAKPESNTIRIVVCESRNKTQDGAMIYIRFKILEDVSEGTYPITLDYSKGDFSNYAMDYIIPTVEDGRVTVLHCDHPESDWVLTDPTFEMEGSRNLVCKVCGKALEKNPIIKLVYGDLSRDGVLKSNDLVELRRFTLGTLSVENYVELVADVNGDNAVDVRDLVRLKKYFAGSSVDLGNPEDSTQSSVQSSVQSSENTSSAPTYDSSENVSQKPSSDSSMSSATNDSSCDNTSSKESENNYTEPDSSYYSSEDTTTSNP
ncbi:MAG: hypothetical protein J6D52_08330 [Clostridia bacterium]|nr:hypothetical protein [Clostridia bacterium]